MSSQKTIYDNHSGVPRKMGVSRLFVILRNLKNKISSFHPAVLKLRQHDSVRSDIFITVTPRCILHMIHVGVICGFKQKKR